VPGRVGKEDPVQLNLNSRKSLLLTVTTHTISASLSSSRTSSLNFKPRRSFLMVRSAALFFQEASSAAPLLFSSAVRRVNKRSIFNVAGPVKSLRELNVPVSVKALPKNKEDFFKDWNLYAVKVYDNAKTNHKIILNENSGKSGIYL
jgi:hypothetical protein